MPLRPGPKSLAVIGGVAICAAALAIAGLWSKQSPPSPPPRTEIAAVAPEAPPPAPRNQPGRIYAEPGETLDLSGVEKVESLLSVPGRMEYGASIWNDRGVPPGPLLVRVDREAQIISVFRGPHEIGTAVILYGAPQKPTPAGRYPILERKRAHRSNLYDADMPFMLRLTGDGIAIHASNVREGRATHGCVGLPDDFAEKLFEAARVGDPVMII